MVKGGILQTRSEWSLIGADWSRIYLLVFAAYSRPVHDENRSGGVITNRLSTPLKYKRKKKRKKHYRWSVGSSTEFYMLEAIYVFLYLLTNNKVN